MAGIGFELKKLRQRDTITSLVAAAGHAAVLAAGPWLFTILSLATITLITDRVAGLETLATFRVVIIYAFALSLVMTAPVTIIVTRLVADALWLKQPQKVRPLLLAAFVWAVALVALAVLPLIAYFRPPTAIAMVLASSSMLVGLIWVVLSFCGAIRDYAGVTLSFVVGLLVSMLASIWAAILGLGAPGMLLGFMLGLTITFMGLTWRVLATFPHPVLAPSVALAELAVGCGRYWRLALGALAGTAGVWIDKWIFWFSPAGERLGVGLLHAPLYDSAMFIASLGIIPALSAFVLRLETDFFEHYQRYYATISSHGTLTQIEAARRRLATYTLDHLTLITVSQMGICAVLAMTAPLIVDALGLQFRQVSILRYGAIGAVFQFIFIACSAILLFFDRRRLYLALQTGFLCAMTAATLVSVKLGDEFYGTGYFVACLVMAFGAFVLAEQTFTRLNFLTFIGNNPSIEAARSLRPAGLLARVGRRLARRPA